MDPTTALIAAVLLGPLAALYDFCANPNAPPQIFVAQYTEAFGHPPGLVPGAGAIPGSSPGTPRPEPKSHKRVYLTHG